MNRRKKLYVSKVIQGRILKRTFLCLLLYALVMWQVMFFCDIQGNLPSRTLGEMYATFFIDNMWLAVFFAVLTPFFFYGILKLTNEVVGPLIPLERALRAMTRGERVEPIELRKGDMLVEFTNVFNEFVTAHNRKLDPSADPEQPQELVEC